MSQSKVLKRELRGVEVLNCRAQDVNYGMECEKKCGSNIVDRKRAGFASMAVRFSVAANRGLVHTVAECN